MCKPGWYNHAAQKEEEAAGFGVGAVVGTAVAACAAAAAAGVFVGRRAARAAPAAGCDDAQLSDSVPVSGQYEATSDAARPTGTEKCGSPVDI